MSTPTLALWPGKEHNTGRAYRNPFTGETLPSVTTILKQSEKGTALAQWAVNMTLDWANRNWDILGTRSDSDAKRAGQYQWTKVRDERAEVGTGVHEAIEAYFTGSGSAPFLDAEQEAMVGRFDEFLFDHDVQVEHVEFTVWSPGKYAGTADWFGLVDGVPVCVDNKTSKNTWPEHYAQLAALVNAPYALIQVPEDTKDSAEHVTSRGEKSWWVQVPNPALGHGAAILHLREDFYKWLEVGNLDEHYAVFEAYVAVHQAKERLKIAEKAASMAGENEEENE